MTPDLIPALRDAFGWDGEVTLAPGPRGALGQIWRLDAGPARFALKEIFGEPPSPALVEAELAFARRAVEAGVRLPASHADRAGRYVLALPGTGSAVAWLRLYDWVDLSPVDLAAPATPAALGALLARLHRCAPAAPVEPDGTAPDPWYHEAPAPPGLAGRLGERVAQLPELCAAVGPADPATLILCHRDLHPENVLAVGAVSYTHLTLPTNREV